MRKSNGEADPEVSVKDCVWSEQGTIVEELAHTAWGKGPFYPNKGPELSPQFALLRLLSALK